MKEEGEEGENENEKKSRTETEKLNIRASIKLLKNNKSKHLRRVTVINKEKSLLEQYGKCIDEVIKKFE